MLFTIFICQFFSFSSLGSSFVLQLYFSTTDFFLHCFLSNKETCCSPLLVIFLSPHALSFYPSHFVATSLRKFSGATIQHSLSIFFFHILSLLLKEIALSSTYTLQSLRKSLKAEGKSYRGFFTLLATGVQMTHSLT